MLSAGVGDLGLSVQFLPKKLGKISNIHKDFELNQVFMNHFLCQKFPIFQLYILRTRRMDTFWYKGVKKFWSGGIDTVWHRKLQTKNLQNSQRI